MVDPLGDLPQASLTVDRETVQLGKGLVIAVDEEDVDVFLSAGARDRVEEHLSPPIVGCEAEVAELQHHSDSPATCQPDDIAGTARVGVPVAGKYYHRGLGRQQRVWPHQITVAHYSGVRQAVYVSASDSRQVEGTRWRSPGPKIGTDTLTVTRSCAWRVHDARDGADGAEPLGRNNDDSTDQDRHR